MRASETELALWTKRDRKTVRAKLVDLEHEIGPRGAKMFESHIALAILFGVDGSPSKEITAQEASRRLTLKRTEEIDLGMEVTRKERIPLEEIEECNDAALQNCAGILKAHEGKTLTPELTQELFAELRRMGEIIRTPEAIHE